MNEIIEYNTYIKSKKMRFEKEYLVFFFLNMILQNLTHISIKGKTL